MRESDLRRNGRGCGEMVNNLVRLELRMDNVDVLEGPEEVEAGRLFVLIFYPTTAFESAFDVAIAALYDEDFCIGVDPIFLLPLLHIGDIEFSNRHHLLVPLEEVIECFGIYRCSRLGRRRRGYGWLLLQLLFITLLLHSTVLLLAERR